MFTRQVWLDRIEGEIEEELRREPWIQVVDAGEVGSGSDAAYLLRVRLLCGAIVSERGDITEVQTVALRIPRQYPHGALGWSARFEGPVFHPNIQPGRPGLVTGDPASVASVGAGSICVGAKGDSQDGLSLLGYLVAVRALLLSPNMNEAYAWGHLRPTIPVWARNQATWGARLEAINARLGATFAAEEPDEIIIDDEMVFSAPVQEGGLEPEIVIGDDAQDEEILVIHEDRGRSRPGNSEEIIIL